MTNDHHKNNLRKSGALGRMMVAERMRPARSVHQVLDTFSIRM